MACMQQENNEEQLNSFLTSRTEVPMARTKIIIRQVGNWSNTADKELQARRASLLFA